MTEAQARQYVEEAEKLPPGKIDKKRLAEAIETLEKANPPIIKIDWGRFLSDAWQWPAGQVQSLLNSFGALGELTGESVGSAVEALPSGEPFRPRPASNVLHRARSLAGEVATTEAAEKGGPTVRGEPGRETEPLGPGRLRGGGTPQERFQAEQARRTPTGPSSLVNRFFQAAARAGIDRDEATARLTELRQQAQGGGPQTFTDPLTGETLTFDPSQFPGYEEPPSVEELVGGQIAVWMQGVIGNVQFAQRDEPIPVGEGLERFRRERGITPGTRTQEVAARYFVGDEQSYAGLSTERIVEIQRQLAAAGVMVDGDYWPGVWDAATDGTAMLGVMENANAAGLTVDEMLEQMIATTPESAKEARARAKAEAAMADTFTAPAYLKPDPAALSQAVKSAVRSQLGREPTDGEMGELAGVMSQSFRADYEAEVAAMQAEFDAMRAYEEQVMADIEAGGTGEGTPPPTAGTFQSVNPQARFREAFDQRFGPELDFIEGQADQVRNANNVFASIVNMGRLVG